MYFKCTKCKDKVDLHVGDKIAFAHNKTFFSHSDLVLLADSKGLLTASDEYIDTKYSVINPRGAKKSDYSKASKLKIRVLEPSDFELKIKKVCSGVFPKTTKKPLAQILSRNSRVYPLELSGPQLLELAEKIQPYGAKISKQRRKSITAVVCRDSQSNSGRANLFRSWGIPIYSYGKVIRNL